LNLDRTRLKDLFRLPGVLLLVGFGALRSPA
jgi:hypothetical protein